MSSRPVVVFEGENEFEAQMVRDLLQTAMIPVLHVPSLSTGLFAQRQTTRVAVPEDRAEEAIALLQDEGFHAGETEPPKGLGEVNDAMGRAFPKPLRLIMLAVFLGMFVIVVIASISGGGR